jgi:tetratricopeptide (TPR) repeat protein
MVSISDQEMRLIQKAVVAVFIFWSGIFATYAADPVKVIIFPLSGSARSTSLSWLGEGIAISLSEQISGQSIKAMDRSQRVELVERIDLPPGAQLSRGSMIQVAQRASADLAVMGTYSGSEKNLRISIRVLNVKALKLSGEISANGPLSVLPQLENELAWLILSNNGLEKTSSREEFQKRMRAIPNTAFAYYIQSYGVSNENDQIRLLQKAVAAFRNYPEAQFRIGSLYFQKGDCSSAIPHLVLGSSKAGIYSESQFMLGTCYLQGDQTVKAIQMLAHVLQFSRPFEVLNNLGVAYLRSGDLALGINSLVEARNLARSNTTVALNLAIARHLQHNDPAARSVLEDAINIDSNNGMLQFVLGYLLKIQGESEAAALALDRAKNLGINIENLQQEDPKTWTRIISNLENFGVF